MWILNLNKPLFLFSVIFEILQIIELILFSFFNYRKSFMVPFGHSERYPIRSERQY